MYNFAFLIKNHQSSLFYCLHAELFNACKNGNVSANFQSVPLLLARPDDLMACRKGCSNKPDDLLHSISYLLYSHLRIKIYSCQSSPAPLSSFPDMDTSDLFDVPLPTVPFNRSSFRFIAHPHIYSLIIPIHRSSALFITHHSNSSLIRTFNRSSFRFIAHPLFLSLIIPIHLSSALFITHHFDSSLIRTFSRSSFQFIAHPHFLSLIIPIHHSSALLFAHHFDSSRIRSFYRSSFRFITHPPFEFLVYLPILHIE